MRHLKVLGATLVAMLALGVTALGMTATSAFALPDVSLLAGSTETFPVDLHFADNGTTATRLETAAGPLLTGEGVELLLELTKLSSLGTFSTDFLNVTNAAKESCHSFGDKAGVVLVTGEWHLVPITTKPLLNGIAFLLGSLLLIECPSEKIDIRGCSLASTTVEEGKDYTGVTGALGSNGKGQANHREYLNDVPENVKCVLTTEIVNTKKPVEGAEVVNGGTAIEATITSGSLGKMVEFTGL